MKIKFKDIDKVDLTSIFPPINKEEYKLIEGQELILDIVTYKKLKDNKYLVLGDHQISEDLITVIKAGSISDAQILVQQEVEKNFIYSEDVVDVLMTGIEMGKNVILYGRGGHGKSEITELLLDTLYKNKFINSEPFVQALGDGMTEEKLFGGMDIKKFKEEGILEYLPQFSWMNHEIVVFEEIFDAPPQILLSLKDIITSGRFRQGNQSFAVKTKIIIGLTNKSKKDFAERSDSLKALAERFPLTLKVEWSSYTKASFMKLFKKVLPEEDVRTFAGKLSTLANIIDMNNSNGVSFVSPRTAVAAAQIYIKGKPLEYISEIDKKILAEYNKKIQDEVVSKDQIEFINKIESYIETNELELINGSEDFLKAIQQIDIDSGNKPVDLTDFNTENTGDSKVKISQTRYLLDLINRVNFTQQNFNVSSNLKKRLNTIETKLLKSNEITDE